MTETERQFHNSRLMWMRIENRLIWTRFSDLSHEEWFNSLFINSDIDYNTIDRGYIKIDKETKTCNIMMYKGRNFGRVKPSRRLVEQCRKSPDDLKLLAILYVEYMGDASIFRVCNGVKVGKPGDIWEPLEVLETFSIKKNNLDNISIKQVLNYEDILVTLLNKSIYSHLRDGNVDTGPVDDFIINELHLVHDLISDLLMNKRYNKQSCVVERVIMAQYMII